jgi:hypothetical protein
MKKIFSLFVILFFFALPFHSQSLMEDLKAVSGVLDTAKSVHIQVVCKIYTDRDGQLVNTVNTGVLKKGKMSVSTFDDMEVFTNDKYGVYVSGENKSIMLISKSKHSDRIQSIDDKGIDQFISWMKKQQTKTSFHPVLITDEGGLRTYSIKDLEDLKEVLIVINTNNKSILNISYEYSESSKQKQKFILLNYSKFLVNSKEIHLDQTDYYIQQSGKFLPGKKYKSYSITTDL